MSESTTPKSPVLLDVRQVATLLGCSPSHVYRLSDAGQMPHPVKLGRVLIRWSKLAIERWVNDGCPNCPKKDGGAE